MTKKVMVLMGGFSAEREVSLQSGAGIAEALRRKGYEVTTHDLSDTRQLLAELGRSKPDVVFNALHGNWGEDGTVPALLDLLQIPYTHSGMQASCVGMNKYLCRLIAEKAGLKTAYGRKLTAGNSSPRARRLPARLSSNPYPTVLRSAFLSSTTPKTFSKSVTMIRKPKFWLKSTFRDKSLPLCVITAKPMSLPN